MTHEPPSPRRFPISLAKGLRLALLGVGIGLAALAVAVGPGWFRELPRATQRDLVEGLLRALICGYSALVAAALGVPVLAWRLKRRWRSRSPRLERAFLASLACLVALAGLEIGSTAWRAWMHRLPTLPRFSVDSTEVYRIVVLGGSSALGEPYRPWVSVGQIVADRIQAALPGRVVECEILAWLGEDLEQQHQRLARITHRPDMVIVYSGHNEFAARFEEERVAWLDLGSGSRVFRVLNRALLVSPFCRLVHEIVSKNRLDLPPLAGRHRLIDPPQASESETAEILADFRRRLEAITAYCETIQAIPVLIIPPANETDYEPSRSTLPASVGLDERRRLVLDFERARALESDQPQQAEELYTAIVARHGEFAEAHFRLGRLLETSGRSSQAAPHFLAALDHDGLPIRCPAPFRAAYQEVASRHPRAILVDGRAALSSVSSTGLIGDEVIQDTHHPTLRGMVALARAVLHALKGRGLVAPNLDDHLSVPVIAARFGLTSDRWTTVCERTAVHYRRVAGYRHDGAERMAKAARYTEAVTALRQGATPEELRLPGVGVSENELNPSAP